MPRPTSLPGLPDDYTSVFFLNDLIKPIGGRDREMVRVIRCWADDDMEIPADVRRRDPLWRPLLRGEVHTENPETGRRSIDPESTFTLVSREFMRGEIVKRDLTDLESAVVVEAITKVKLESLYLIGHRLPEWVPWNKLANALTLERKDKVVYQNWLGTVDEVLEDGIVKPAFGPMYKISGTGGMLQVGRTVQQIRDSDMLGGMFVLPPHANPSVDKVCSVQPAVVLICWHAVNQTLPIDQQDIPEPPKIFHGDDIKKLTHFDGLHAVAPQLRTQVKFINAAAEHQYTATLGISSASLSIPKATNLFSVVEISTDLRVRWQDGHETIENSLGFKPYRNVDDYECWPGEHILWKGEGGEQRFAVVQSFDAKERIASLQFSDDKTVDSVPVLELDPGGMGRASYGAGVGLTVLITNNNGAEFPTVPPLGRLESGHDHINSQGELAAFAEHRCRQLQLVTTGDTNLILRPQGDKSACDWFGEVIDHKLDGAIVVRLANGLVVEKLPTQLYTLNDPMVDVDMFEHLHDPGQHDDLAHHQQHDHHAFHMHGFGGIANEFAQMFGYHGYAPFDADGMSIDGDGNERISVIEGDGSVGDGEGWETVSEEGNGARRTGWADDSGMDVDQEDSESAQDEAEVRQMVLEPSPDDCRPTSAAPQPNAVGESFANENGITESRSDETICGDAGPSCSTVPAASSQVNGASTSGVHVNAEAGPSSAPYNSANTEEDGWDRFEMLDEAPAEHQYYEKPQAAGNRAYMNRVQKEHRALMSSLPENILVRAYEDRLDLLRVLIFGPDGTPYSDAPFVFDVYLDPSKFPHEPPSVYFHSHTSGHGRCNPNLYEDGKVCLSILGTWQGNKSESWSAQNSSLLQVFVSISGLVLVRSPYHCEPAFAKLEGTREGRVNSRHYSEKAYVLSRTFVRTALTRPPASLDKEIKHYYFARGHLKRVIQHAKSLMDKTDAKSAGNGEEEGDEENAEMWNADAVGSLTKGAVISLKRTIPALERLLEEYEAGNKAA